MDKNNPKFFLPQAFLFITCDYYDRLGSVVAIAPSSGAHVDEAARGELLNLTSWYKMISAKEWRSELASGIDEAQMARIRLSTHTGRPLGTDSFVSKIEKMLGRRVRPSPIGRPRKKTTKC